MDTHIIIWTSSSFKTGPYVLNTLEEISYMAVSDHDSWHGTTVWGGHIVFESFNQYHVVNNDALSPASCYLDWDTARTMDQLAPVLNEGGLKRGATLPPAVIFVLRFSMTIIHSIIGDAL